MNPSPTRLHTLAGLALALTLLACSKPEAAAKPAGGEKAAAKPIPVETAAVASVSLSRRLTAVGGLVSDESVTLASEVAGRITGVHFNEGGPVAKGALLFTLDDSVNRAELAQARANLALSVRNDARAGEIAGKGLLSNSERETVAAKLQIDRAALQLAEAKIAKTRINAPLAGVSGLRLVSTGDYVSAGQALVNIEAMNPIKAEFRLPEAALSQIRVGQKLSVEVDAWPGEIFAGELYAIDPRLADASRSIALRARLDNRQGKLRPGLYARIRLDTAEPLPALTVPEQAVFPQGEQLYVYVVADGKAQLRPVKVGSREPGLAEITEGLTAGELVVTAGIQKLSPGAPVSLAAAAAEKVPANSP